MKLSEITKSYKEWSKVTNTYKKLSEPTRSYKKLSEVTRSYKKLSEVTRSYKKLSEVTKMYQRSPKGLKNKIRSKPTCSPTKCFVLNFNPGPVERIRSVADNYPQKLTAHLYLTKHTSRVGLHCTHME